jgi:2,4-dienoyl-CoA reductase-like NADH-dependent reductase (Old Yellow Enzyme family)
MLFKIVCVSNNELTELLEQVKISRYYQGYAMSLLFTPKKIGTLELPNRLVRSATAERMADDVGRPDARLVELYRRLAQGGVGLIISGHMYLHPTGKAHPEMTGIYADELIPDLAKLTEAVHSEGGLVAVQINHGGMNANGENISEPLAPSTLSDLPFLKRPTRELEPDEIEMLVAAFAQAARRAKQAGFDAVQLHAAHGYLVSQFLSPAINQRQDDWGGSIDNRMRFLRRIAGAVRVEVGAEYPVFIKLGMKDGIEGGLTLKDSLKVVAALADMGIDAVELSGGIGGGDLVNARKGIRKKEEEAYFLPFAQQARQVTNLPIMLVGGLRSRHVMNQILVDGHADFISICRPLINAPDFPNQLRQGKINRSGCLSANNCWAENMGEGIACKCPVEKVNTMT